VPTFCNRLCDSDLEALEAIRKACHGLLPSWQNPHAFFEQRSSITGSLTKLIRLIASEPRQLNGRVPRPDVLPHQVRTAAAIRLAEQTFSRPAVRSASVRPAQKLHAATLVLPAIGEPMDPKPAVASFDAPPAGAPLALAPPLEVLELPATPRKRHRYPMPPHRLNGQGTLPV
jgi:hypothetical protein